MTGHELLPDQTATPPSRPADNLAPVACRIAITGLSMTSVTERSALTASPSHHTPKTSPIRYHLTMASEPAKSRKTHSVQPVVRGFGLPGLSGAYRQPKLFRQAARPLLGAQAGKAAVQQATVL